MLPHSERWGFEIRTFLTVSDRPSNDPLNRSHTVMIDPWFNNRQLERFLIHGRQKIGLGIYFRNKPGSICQHAENHLKLGRVVLLESFTRGLLCTLAPWPRCRQLCSLSTGTTRATRPPGENGELSGGVQISRDSSGMEEEKARNNWAWEEWKLSQL